MNSVKKICPSFPHRFGVHLKLYSTHLKVPMLYCPVQLSQDLRVRYPGYVCPNVPALTVQIGVCCAVSFSLLDCTHFPALVRDLYCTPMQKSVCLSSFITVTLICYHPNMKLYRFLRVHILRNFYNLNTTYIIF